MYRVTQTEYAIRIPVSALQEYVNSHLKVLCTPK